MSAAVMHFIVLGIVPGTKTEIGFGFYVMAVLLVALFNGPRLARILLNWRNPLRNIKADKYSVLSA